MDAINIFITGTASTHFADFAHGDTRYLFDTLTPDGPRRLVEGPVCAFVDWVMDDMSGLEMCRRLRADPRMAEAHITMILEADDGDDKRRALKAGADDYMIGPVDRTTVLDRVLSLRSAHSAAFVARVITCGPLEIDMAALQARWGGDPITLRPNEFRLLRYFAENPDRVLSRQDLIGGLGKQEPPIDERTVDVWVGRLRRALRRAGAGDPVRTIRSLGYVFDSH